MVNGKCYSVLLVHKQSPRDVGRKEREDAASQMTHQEEGEVIAPVAVTALCTLYSLHS